MLHSARAGLVILILITFSWHLSTVYAAPITNRQTGLSYGDHNCVPISLASTTFSPSDGKAMSDPLPYPNINPSMETLERRGLGAKLRAAFHKVAHGIEHVAHAVAHGIAHVATTVAKKVASGVTTAAKKVWHVAKTVGAQAVKFGTKLVATGEKLVAKAAGFFPEFGGKALERAMNLHANLVNKISDSIHVKMPAKLMKGEGVLNKINKVSGYVPL